MGSIPTAFLILKLKSGIDIRNAGSGNVGGFNAFVVTGSKYTGVLVGVLDGVKGFAAAGIAGPVLGGDFWIQAAAMSGAVVGHIYPVWLKFKGGRGLATAAGAFFTIGVSYTVVWCLTWFLLYRTTKNITRGNLVAVLLTPVIVAVLPMPWIQSAMIRTINVAAFREFSFILSAILLTSHLDALKEFFQKPTQ